VESLRLRDQLSRKRSSDSVVPVTLILENGERYPLQGRLEFSESTVEQGTGSITLRAVFANPDHLLLPGMFVRALIDTVRIDDGLLLPPQAVSRDARGRPLVMVVGAGNRVEPRILDEAQLVNDQWLVQGGIKVGDQVVVAGLQHVHPGTEVVVSGGSAPDHSSVQSTALY
ncbi:MAG: efflux RND transporter periplasmic adaptor subunit, partial [Chromatiales bacterium]|nr:efflux RND transporter periplasmic adaptor subunit [Chromatiales bacterium]